jgi:hypothetical protein
MKHQLNEIRRMQQLAGILTEAEEAQAIATGEQIAAKVEDNTNLENTIDKLSDEQKAALQQELAKLGVTATSNVEDVAAKIEDKVPQDVSEAEQDPKKKVANTLNSIGTGLIGTLLVPMIPAALGTTLGIGFAGGLGVTFAAAGLLLGLAKALGRKEPTSMRGNN